MAASAVYDTVYIGSLPPGTNESIIKEIFGQYAPIHAVKVLETPGTAVEALVGIGKEASKWVVDNLNGNIPQGFQTPVTIQLMPPEQTSIASSPLVGQAPQSSGPPRDNLRIQGLPDGCTDDYFKQIFSQYATVVGCKVVPQAPGREDCFGFMKFGSVEEAKYILDTLNGNIPQGLQKPLSIKYASDRAGLGGSDGTEDGDWQCELCSNMNFRRRDYCNICHNSRPAHYGLAKGATGGTVGFVNKPRAETPPNIQLYINGLPLGTNEESLKQFFLQYGEVYHSKVLPPGLGKNVQSGFVRMPEFEAQWCIENLHHFQPEGFPGPLTVEYAKDKETGKKGGPKGCMGAMGSKGGCGMGGMGAMGMGDMAGMGKGAAPDASAESGFSNGCGGKDASEMVSGDQASWSESWDAKGKGGKDGMSGMGKGKDDSKGCGMGKGGDPWGWGGWGGWGPWSDWGDWSFWGPMMMMKGKGKMGKKGPYWAEQRSR